MKFNDRFSQRKPGYFNWVHPYQHHTGGFDHNGANEKGFIYLYSFALKPEEHQPSGTCNFSRIDAKLIINSAISSGKVHVYAINYNLY